MAAMTTAARTRKRAPAWPAVLFTLALAATVPTLVTNVWPALSFQVRPQHAGHWPLVWLHALSGTVALNSGSLGLYIGWTRRWFGWHRHIGCIYLGFGFTMAAMALWLALINDHAPHSTSVSTGTLAIVWSLVAAMGWRAGANRRFDSHRDWMIRSFVLTWTFVFCRLAQRGELFGALGEEGVTAGIWLYWVGPLLVTELALQWRRGARPAAGSTELT